MAVVLYGRNKGTRLIDCSQTLPKLSQTQLVLLCNAKSVSIKQRMLTRHMSYVDTNSPVDGFYQFLHHLEACSLAGERDKAWTAAVLRPLQSIRR